MIRLKRTNILVLVILITIILIACSNRRVIYTEGVFRGTGQGHHGEIVVEITTSQYRIKKIDIIEQQEVPVLSDIVYEKIPPKVIKKNSTDVDVVAGATLTSDGLLEAIEDALNKAKVKND